MNSALPGKRLLLAFGVFFTSLSILTLEITITRIASVVMYYHFSFLAVSLALLGSGIGGIYVFLAAPRFPKDGLGKPVVWACLFQSATSLLALIALLSIRLNLQVSWSWLVSGSGIGFLFVIVLLVLPFFFGGIALSLVLRHYSAQANWLYFADLIGAGLGCLVIVFAFEQIGGINAIFLICLFPVVAALIFSLLGASRRDKLVAVAVGVALVLMSGFNAQAQFVRIRFPKGEIETPPTYEKWNAYSRVAVYPPNLLSKNGEPWDPGKNIPVNRMGIDIDAGAWTSIVQFDGNLDKLTYLRSDIAAVPYYLNKNKDVLVIGSGGGQDVLIASLFGTQQVTAVEMNPIMFSIVDDRFGDFSGRVYQRPGVRAIIDEARSFIRHSPDRFDIIQATLVDTFAASSAGAYALSENYLYTQEAFVDYWDHLKDDGVLAMTRWYFEPPVEVLRLLSLSLSAMQEKHIEHPENHIVIMRQDFRATFLLKKSEFTAEDIANLRQAEEEGGFEFIYLPFVKSDSDFARLIAQPTAFVSEYAQNISAPTDDKPFFFYNVKPGSNPISTILQMFQGENEPSTLLIVMFCFLLSLVLLFLFVPLIVFAKANTLNYSAEIIYFAGLGLGFILVEIALIQRFILFLGHPIYALAVILFSLLFFGGMGSLLSGLFGEKIRAKAHVRVLICLSIFLVVYGLGFAWFINTFIGLDTIARIILTVIVLCPLGLLMGMPFPLGIKAIGDKSPSLIPWLWGVNGALSVVGSVFAAILAINFGLGITFLAGFVTYLLVLGILVFSKMLRLETTT